MYSIQMMAIVYRSPVFESVATCNVIGLLSVLNAAQFD